MLTLISSMIVGKLVLFVSRLFKLGGGSAAPGLYALKIDPQLIEKLASQIPNSIVITGTNGKTTTAKMLAHFATSAGQKVLRNNTGSNLERGVASTLIKHANIFGQIKEIDLAIWELDEAAFNKLLPKLKPALIVILNAFRDQLDRYGEVDTVTKNWTKTLEKVNWEAKVLINASDPNLLELRSAFKNTAFFQLKGHTLSYEKTLSTDLKVTADYTAEVVKDRGLSGSEFKLSFGGEQRDVNLEIPGVYHIYNFLAAFAVFFELNLAVDKLFESVASYKPAFGRVEKIQIKGREAVIFLIKNPAGATVVFETLIPSVQSNDLFLLALNDNFADGLDVSWIWDAKFELLFNEKLKNKLIVSGQRAADLANRLKYSGVDIKQIEVETDLEKALDQACQKAKGRIFILPTYTAMLELQKILTKLGIKKHYWEEE